MPQLRLIALLLIAAVGPAACASAPVISRESAVALAKADGLVVEGCYDCLTEARDLYAQVAVGKARPIVLPRLFETTVLLALREKELAMSPSGRFDAAKALIPELPVAYPARIYLDSAMAVLPDTQGTPRREMSTLKRPTTDQYVSWQTSLQAGDGGALFRRYLSISLDCTLGTQMLVRATSTGSVSAIGPNAMASAWTAMPTASTDPPGNLLAYRRANCARTDTVMLAGLADGDPRFLEAGLLGRRIRSVSPTSQELAQARAWLPAAAAKWPQSIVPVYALGAMYQTAGDCKTALTYYDKAIALKPRHEDSHLGRLVCLSYARQSQAAIVEATQMIADGNNEGESRYWRAWNERELGQLPAARADSDRMKQILYNDRAMTLAGQIEHDLSDLGIADTDLKAGMLNPNNCVAAWYWSLVQLKKEAWPDAAEGFVKAMGCYETAVAYDRSKIDEYKKMKDIEEDFRASQIAGFETAAKDDASQISASALNAAVNYARAQNRAKSIEYLELAAKDPQRAEQVAQLRAILK